MSKGTKSKAAQTRNYKLGVDEKGPTMRYDFKPEYQFFEQKFTGSSPEMVESLVARFLVEIPRIAEEEWGIPITVRRDDIDAGGLMGGLKKLAKVSDGSENMMPTIVISSNDHKEYARVIVVFKPMGRVCDFQICQYGPVSGNYQRVVQRKLLANKRAFEEEKNFYEAMIQIARDLMCQ